MNVISSAIARVEYLADSLILRVWFHESGGPYDYYGVPAWKYQNLLSAPSKGQYFNQHIRDQHSANR